MLLRTKRQLETMWEVRTGINGCPVYRCPSLNITQVSLCCSGYVMGIRSVIAKSVIIYL